MEWGRMKVVLRTGVGRGEVTEESGERRGESWKFYKFGMMGLKRVLEKDFEAFSSANLMKMRCRSDWDTSRGLKPSKMGQKCDFARKKKISPEKNPDFPEQTARPHVAILQTMAWHSNAWKVPLGVDCAPLTS